MKNTIKIENNINFNITLANEISFEKELLSNKKDIFINKNGEEIIFKYKDNYFW